MANKTTRPLSDGFEVFSDDGTSTVYDIIPPSPTLEHRGGIIADTKTENDTVEVKIGEDGKGYVPTYPVINDEVVKYNETQELTDEQKFQAMNNIGVKTCYWRSYPRHSDGTDNFYFANQNENDKAIINFDNIKNLTSNVDSNYTVLGNLNISLLNLFSFGVYTEIELIDIIENKILLEIKRLIEEEAIIDNGTSYCLFYITTSNTNLPKVHVYINIIYTESLNMLILSYNYNNINSSLTYKNGVITNNNIKPQYDTTLTFSDAPADAKTVGDRFASVEENIKSLDTNPDYDENDETSKAYIKNRPCYKAKENIIVYDGAICADQIEMLDTRGIDMDYDITVTITDRYKEKIYENTYAAKYKTDAIDGSKYYYYGNECLAGRFADSLGLAAPFRDDDGTPFALLYFNGWYAFIDSSLLPKTDSIGVYYLEIKSAKMETVYHPLEEGYIPDSIARTENLPKKLTDLENDLFYKKSDLYMSLTEENTIWNDDGTGMGYYSYDFSDSFDFLNSKDSIDYVFKYSLSDDFQYEVSKTDNANLNNNEFRDSYLYIQKLDDGGHIEINVENYQKFNNFTMEIYQNTFKKVPEECIDTEKIYERINTLEEKSVPSDFEQNNNEAPNFIYNRPFFEDDNNYIYINDYYSFGKNELGIYVAELPFCDIEANQKLNLNLDDGDCLYSRVTVLTDSDNNHYIGNKSLMYPEFENTGESYLLISIIDHTNDNRKTYLYTTYTQDEHHIKLSLYKLKQLDEKYLPDTTKYQGNWVQNNADASDYVLGRTHYKYTENVLLSEFSFSISDFEKDENGIYGSNPTLTVPFYENISKIRFDEIDYNVTCVSVDGYQYIGNHSLLNNRDETIYEDTGEPFLIVDPSNAAGLEPPILYTTIDHDSTMFLYSNETETKYKTLDENYLPDSIARVDYVNDIAEEKQNKNFIINFTSTKNDDDTYTYSVDKTFAQIEEAYNKDCNLILKFNYNFYKLNSFIPGSSVSFHYWNQANSYYHVINIYYDDTVYYIGRPTVASETIAGGIKAVSKTDDYTIECKIGDDQKLYIPEGDSVIKPLPVYETRGNTVVRTHYVDIEALENHTYYGALILEEDSKASLLSYVFNVICDDGTKKRILTTSKMSLMYVIKGINNSTVELQLLNSAYSVDYSDKSTADNVNVVVTNLIRYLPTANTLEYTPTTDYNPATKKYVDQSKSYIILKDQSTGYDYNIRMVNGSLVSSLLIDSIEIVTLPDKTSYIEGEPFDITGLVINEFYSSGDSSNISIDDITYEPEYITADITEVIITYTKNGQTFTQSIAIEVTPFVPAIVLVDFEYTVNDDGTYTITSWKGTLNGVESEEMVIPNNSLVIVNIAGETENSV